MDVHANDYVNESIDFMTASASKSEIERFGLRAGDVVITKDSETPDDIGVPAVVVDSVDGLVCGYHLALIRPRSGAINSVYLAKQLSSAPTVRYFSVNASGSTRFGLPIGVIENTQIPIAPELEQTKIAEILSTVDRAIEQAKTLGIISMGRHVVVRIVTTLRWCVRVPIHRGDWPRAELFAAASPLPSYVWISSSHIRLDRGLSRPRPHCPNPAFLLDLSNVNS